jgi:hypothetical protein
LPLNADIRILEKLQVTWETTDRRGICHTTIKGKKFQNLQGVGLDTPDDIDLNLIVGRVLARFRSEAGIAQERLAEAAGLDTGYISLIERG